VARNQRKRPKSNPAAILLFAALVACNRERPVSATPKPAPAAAAQPAPARVEPSADRGEIMPAYSAKLLDGKSFDISSEKGNVVLLNVWATWCGPCRVEIPELQALHKKYNTRGFKVVGVSLDEGGDAEVKKFVAEKDVTYPIAIDAEGRIANILRTTVLPTTVLVGRDGRIVWRKVGAIQPNETAALDTLIEQNLRSPSS
jgi:cytochrome c biogenesis protein CcmG, thiol:disulfide interchange protein DsbE